ncbi:hypothetical protein FRACYDRAFT_240726 [Fragilariopsis cylindrus CCMP1102]|uniref:Uncharacterized protein n=1 Tax=Fragilariopsis cylindrus CCMP1102 TaxID=635003 RepID=A0A1E7F8N8_9STRA|nr:hypothetical protein FRACYDRAFT_240726 [Fragilariopsis cylindrus CCMP1102]|eukprot:OEU14193.1 hypothetical protein FRACYDRAFT_240726 [Fragilariopsis cylindrus CCMP1102]
MNANNEEDHRQQAATAANAARATRAVNRAVTRAAAIAADDDVDVAADVDAAALVARFGRVDVVAADVDAAAVAAAPPPASFLGLYDHIRVNILNYLGETNDELITLTLISKQVYEDCQQPGIEWKIIPTIEIKPRQQAGSTLALLPQLCNYLNTRLYLTSYTHMKQLCNRHNIRRYHCTHMRVYDVHILEEDQAFADIPKSIAFDSILSLDISLSKPVVVPKLLPNTLANILPNLREINLSNLCTNSVGIGIYSVGHVLNNIPHLEKLTWNNFIDYYDDASARLSGWDMREAKNLKEIIMDNFNSEFRMPIWIIDNTRNTCLFFYCSQALERVSIRNLIWGSMYCRQKILIKFVRNVPTLRWFRSDLSEENMIMLRLERPDIEFLN